MRRAHRAGRRPPRFVLAMPVVLPVRGVQPVRVVRRARVMQFVRPARFVRSAALAAALLAGCSSASPPTRWYSLVTPERSDGALPGAAGPATAGVQAAGGQAAGDASSAATPAAADAPAAAATRTAADAPAAAMLIDVLDVGLPERVDVPQLVVTLADGSLQRLEQSQWASPLQRELRDALAFDLMRRLGASDVHGNPRGGPVWRVATTVRRFDSVVGGTSTLQADWTVRLIDDAGGDAGGARGGAGGGARTVARIASRTATRTAAPAPRVLHCSTTVHFDGAGSAAELVQGHRRAIGTLADAIAAAIVRRAAAPCPVRPASDAAHAPAAPRPGPVGAAS